MLAVLYKHRVQTQQLNHKIGESHSSGGQVSNFFHGLHIIQVGACTNHGHLLLLMVVDHSIEPFTYFIFFLIYFVVHVVVIFLSVLGNAITIVAFIQAIRSLSCSACR
jgi:hypothetical protein